MRGIVALRWLFLLPLWWGPSLSAHAESFPYCEDPYTVLPDTNLGDVPTNMAITVLTNSVGQPHVEEYVLVRELGPVDEVVELVVDEHRYGDRHAVVLQPEWPLEPDAEYKLWAGIDSGFPDLSFFTGFDRDDEPPGEVWIRETWSEASGCGSGTGDDNIEVEIVQAIDGGVLYQVEVSANEAFDDSTVVWSSQRLVNIGDYRCGTLPADYARVRRLWLRARTVDIAGNASAWSTPVSTRYDAGGGSYGAVIVVLLGGLRWLGRLRRVSRS